MAEMIPKDDNTLSAFPSVEPTTQGADVVNQYQAGLKRDTAAEESSIAEAATSIGSSMAEMNGVMNIFDFAVGDLHSNLPDILIADDPVFQSNWKQSDIHQYMNDNQIPESYYPRLSEVKNFQGLDIVTRGINRDIDRQETASKYIGQYTQVAAGFAGGIVDADALFPFGKINKMKGVLTNLAKPLTYQAAWEIIRMQTDEDYTETDAVISFAMIGGLSGYMTNRQVKQNNKIIQQYTNTTLDASDSVTKGASFNPNQIIDDAMDEFVFSPNNTRTFDEFTFNPNNTKVIDELGFDPNDVRYRESFDPSPTKVDDLVRQMSDEAEALRIADGVADATPFSLGDTKLAQAIGKITAIGTDEALQMFNQAKEMIDELKFSSVNQLSSEVVEEMNMFIDIVRKSSGELGANLDRLLEIKIRKNADNTFQAVSPSGKPFGKKVPIAIGTIILGSSAANASDGSDVGLSDAMVALMFVAAFAVGGSHALKAFKKSNGSLSKGLNKVIKQGYDSINSVNNIKKSAMAIGESIRIKNMRTRVTETFNRFSDAHTPKFDSNGAIVKNYMSVREMAERLLVNVMDGTVSSAEIVRRELAHTAEAAVARVENIEFEAWKLEKGIKNRPILDFVSNNKDLDAFRNEITDFIDGLNPNASAASQKVAQEFRSQMKILHDKAVEAGVGGFENIKYKDDYVPRYWKSSGIRSMLSADVGEEKVIRKAITQQIENMIHSAAEKRHVIAIQKYADEMDEFKRAADDGIDAPKEPELPTREKSAAEAKKFVQRFADEQVGSGRRVNDASVARLEQQLEAEGIEITEDMQKIFGKTTDKSGRALYKTDMDYSAFKDFDIIIDGKTTTIKLGMLINRDSHSIMAQYANEMGGHISLAKAGGFLEDGSVRWSTFHKARVDANKITNLDIRDDMNIVLNSLAGEDLLNLTVREKQMYEIMSGLAFTIKLPMVTVAMLTEFVKVAGSKNGILVGLDRMSGALLGTHSKHSNIIRQLVNANGRGTASLRHEVNLKGLDDISNMSEEGSAFSGKLGQAANFTRQMKEGASRSYGLLRFSDFLQQYAMGVNTQNLADIMNGKTKFFNAKRAKQYGVTPEMLDTWKKNIKFSKDGEVMDLQLDNPKVWNPKDRDAFLNTQFRMGQNLSQETTMGGTGLYMHNTMFGKSLSYLLTFPAEAFANHGLRDISTGDKEAFRSMFAMFIGGYMSVQVRSLANDGELIDPETAAYRAMTAMPIFGLTNTVTGVTDPVILSTLQSFTDLLKASKYEKDILSED